jgi:SAM-dependent methyltransferase
LNLDHGRLVEEYFHAESSFWKDVYTQDSLSGAIYRARRTAVLKFVDGLGLPSAARVLDVGCGAGSTSVALAKRGYSVDAVDAVPDMIALTARAAEVSQVRGRIRTMTSDVHQLTFGTGTFDVAIAVGVMEWMHSFAGPLQELHRVLRPGGWLIANVDNSQALHCLLDPRMGPFAGPLKRLARRRAEQAGLVERIARPARCSRHTFGRALSGAGFHVVDACTTGFGPFSFLGIHLLPERAGVALHHRLQHWADRRIPLLRNGGDAFLVLAQRRPSLDGVESTLGDA